MTEVFAFLVGIEKYMQAGWDIAGPCANALAVTESLLKAGTPPKQITLFLDSCSDLEPEVSTLVEKAVNVRTSCDQADLDNFWRLELWKEKPVSSKLIVFWSGHGYTAHDGRRVFICHDYQVESLAHRVFDASGFLRHLRSANFRCFRDQIFLADVCSNYGKDLHLTLSDLPDTQEVRNQVAFFASPEGEYARAENGRGKFTEIVLQVLRQARDALEPQAFSALLEETVKQTKLRPFRVVFATSAGETAIDATNLAPSRVAVGRMPVSGKLLFGRTDELTALDSAWSGPTTHIVTLVAWGGVGKTALMNHWLRAMAHDGYRGATRVYAWSFYSQGTSDRPGSGDLFIESALSWFGDPAPTSGSAWQRGERLARLVASDRTLLLLDGLEPLQYPPGPDEGKLKDPAMKALLRELANHNRGLCVISTRIAITDLGEFEDSGVQRVDLDRLSVEAGAQLLISLGAKGSPFALARAAEEFEGHCLALTLLGAYISDAFKGDIEKRSVIGPLENDIRHGGHARRVMASYEKWFGPGPELELLRLIGFFDRPASELALQSLRATPTIPGLADTLQHYSFSEWNQLLAKLRRSKLLADDDPDRPDEIDAHPLVREHFCEQLKANYSDAWRAGNSRLCDYFKKVGRELPETIEEMEPLFQAMVHGCRAGRESETLHEIYLDRIMRRDECFAAYKLGALGPLLSVLSHFFIKGDWGLPIPLGYDGHQGLNEVDQRIVLLEAGIYLTATRSYGAPEVGRAYARAAELSLTELALFPALRGLWSHYLVRASLKDAHSLASQLLNIAQSIENQVRSGSISLVQGQLSGLSVEAQMAMGLTSFYLGDLKSADHHLTSGIEIYDFSKHSGSARMSGNDPGVTCLCFGAFTSWIRGRPDEASRLCDEALLLAERVAHPFSKSMALYMHAQLAVVSHDSRDTMLRAERLIDFCRQQGSAFFLSHGLFFRGWAIFSEAANTVEAAKMQDGLQEMYLALEQQLKTGAILARSVYLIMLAEAHVLAGQCDEAKALLDESSRLLGLNNDRRWESELHRVLGELTFRISSDHSSEAEAHFLKAIDLARIQEARMFQLRSSNALARMHIAQGRPAAAIRLLEEARELFSETSNVLEATENAELIRRARAKQ